MSKQVGERKTATGSQYFNYDRKTYYHDIKLAGNETKFTLFTKSDNDKAKNFKEGNNVFQSQFGGIIKSLQFDLVPANYEGEVFTPSMDNVLKAIGTFKRTALISITQNKVPIVTEEALSKYFPPIMFASKGEGDTDKTKPMSIFFPEFLPLGSTPKMPILTFTKPLDLIKDDVLKVEITFKEGQSVPAALAGYILSVHAYVNEYNGQVAVVAKPASA